MANIFDVAKYILENTGEISTMKLQKLCYYSQAWSLVWTEEPLFHERIEAWANGPVCPELYKKHKGMFKISANIISDTTGDMTDDEKNTIDTVLKFYGEKTGLWLSQLTHMEAPWLNARKGLSVNDRSAKEILLSDMAEYYGSL